MSVHYQDHGVTLHHGDCLDVLAELPDQSVDSVVTDPPYGLRFMGKSWDGADIESATATRRRQAAMPDDGRSGANGGYRSASTEAGRYDLSANAAFGHWCELWARECLRILKPGGYLLTFGGSRTWHRLAAAVEDAGFEIRDSIAWLYGSGFPKSMDVSKAIDKAAGADREPDAYTGANYRNAVYGRGMGGGQTLGRADPVTAAAAAWQGWGTALKPAFEPVVVARKPLHGTVAANVLAHGTGALNIDGCRIGTDPIEIHKRTENTTTASSMSGVSTGSTGTGEYRAGRWPANVILDESQAEALDQQSGTSTSKIGKPRGSFAPGDGWGMTQTGAEYDDVGGASRFFYTAKADQSERITHNGVAHPTVKPLDLMRWLVRLVTQPGGVILEPFAGSGTTIEAAIIEGFQVIGIEREADYLPLITQRINRRRDPVEYLTEAGEDLGLFGEAS